MITPKIKVIDNWNQKAIERNRLYFCLDLILGMKYTRADEIPKSPVVANKTMMLTKAEWIPKLLMERDLASKTAENIPPMATATIPMELITISFDVWENMRDFILLTLPLPIASGTQVEGSFSLS